MSIHHRKSSLSTLPVTRALQGSQSSTAAHEKPLGSWRRSQCPCTTPHCSIRTRAGAGNQHWESLTAAYLGPPNLRTGVTRTVFLFLLSRAHRGKIAKGFTAKSGQRLIQSQVAKISSATTWAWNCEPVKKPRGVYVFSRPCSTIYIIIIITVVVVIVIGYLLHLVC